METKVEHDNRCYYDAKHQLYGYCSACHEKVLLPKLSESLDRFYFGLGSSSDAVD